MKRKNKILIVAEDLGGYNAVKNVLLSLSRDIYFEVLSLFCGTAAKFASIGDKNFVDCDQKDTQEIYKFLEEFKPNLVFFGTGIGDTLDKKVLEWAKKYKIPTLGIIDYWSEYKLRFSAQKSMFLPDKICVIDDYMFNSMVRDGFGKGSLVITGNPYFEDFKEIYNTNENYILFVSQPFSEIKFLSGHRKFDEVEIFSQIVGIIKELGIMEKIIIGLHPRTIKKEKYNKIINDSKLNISIFEKTSSELIAGARLVLGINSMVLFESAIRGKKVVSYQPGIDKEDDSLMSNRIGISCGVYDKESLKKCIFSMYNNEMDKSIKFREVRKEYIDSNPTQKVIDVINNLIR